MRLLSWRLVGFYHPFVDEDTYWPGFRPFYVANLLSGRSGKEEWYEWMCATSVVDLCIQGMASSLCAMTARFSSSVVLNAIRTSTESAIPER